MSSSETADAPKLQTSDKLLEAGCVTTGDYDDESSGCAAVDSTWDDPEWKIRNYFQTIRKIWTTRIISRTWKPVLKLDFLGITPHPHKILQ
jgi:hypothetical protein